MTVDLTTVKIYILPGVTDMRKAVNGLTLLIQEKMEMNPFSGSVYLFCGRDRKLVKAVWWNETGFWLSQKRLEKDKYPWPATEAKARELSAEELGMLLKGIDFFRQHKPVQYQQAG